MQLSLAAQRREQIKGAANLIDSVPASRKASEQMAVPLFQRASFTLVNAGGDYEGSFCELLSMPRA